MKDLDRAFRLTLPAADADAFTDACHEASWHALDTGERIMTDEGPDAEAVLLVVPKKREEKGARAAVPAIA